jgi:hypothetical protein
MLWAAMFARFIWRALTMGYFVERSGDHTSRAENPVFFWARITTWGILACLPPVIYAIILWRTG